MTVHPWTSAHVRAHKLNGSGEDRCWMQQSKTGSGIGAGSDGGTFPQLVHVVRGSSRLLMHLCSIGAVCGT